MQNAETKRLLFEWFYGVQLYLERDSVKSMLSSWREVERKTYILLLEWAIPIQAQINIESDTAKELHDWKYKHHAEAWNVFLTGRFLCEETWEQVLWEDQFNNLREMARVARSEIWNLIQPEESDSDVGRLTPITPVLAEDLEKCLPSRRITLRYQDDPEALSRVQRYLDMILAGSGYEAEEFLQGKKIPQGIQPPTLYPTNPGMRAVKLPDSENSIYEQNSASESFIDQNDDLVIAKMSKKIE